MTERPPPDPTEEPTAAGYRLRDDEVRLVGSLGPSPVTWLGLESLKVAEGKAPAAQTAHLEIAGRRIGPMSVVPGEAGWAQMRHASNASLREVGGVLRDLLVSGGAKAPVPPAALIQEYIEDPALVDARLRALAAWRSTVRVRAGDGPVVTGALVRCDGHHVEMVLAAAPPPGPLLVECQGYNSIYRFEVARAEATPEGIRVRAPTALLRLQHRRAPRAEARPGLRISFLHPLVQDLRVIRAVRDVSRNGLRFVARIDHDLVHAGQVLPEVEVSGPGIPPIRFRAQVRIVLPRAEAGGADGCGLRLQPMTDLDGARWRDLVGGLLLPGTRVGRTWSEHLWELYEASGYLTLSGRTPTHFAPLRNAFATVVRKLDRAPEVGCKVVWPSERGVEASISFLRLYQHTWFGYEIAKRPGDPPAGPAGPQVLFSIHSRAYEMAQADPNLRWVMGFVQQAARWSRRVHFDLPARYAASGQSGIFEFRTWEVPVEFGDPAARGFDVDLASADDVGVLLARLGAERAPAYLETLDLVPGRVHLEHVKGVWEGAALHRDRVLLSARRGKEGPLLAMAVAEAVDPGVHLFGLLDAVRLYPLHPAGRTAFPALLRGAASWYRSLGRTRFSLHAEDLDFLPQGGQDLGVAYITALSSALIPNFLEHLFEVTAPVPR